MLRVVGAAAFVLACGHHDGTDVTATPDACVGLSCFQVDCVGMGRPSTAITGTVYAPNATLPLAGVTVYVPISDPGPLSVGASCEHCTTDLPGGVVVAARTDDAGNFTVVNMPATTNVPVVIQIGKWRRQLVLPSVTECESLPIAATDTTLPRSHDDASPLTAIDGTGLPKLDMPHIALTTGAGDALECLIAKLGVDPTEITNDTGGGHVQLFANTGSASALGAHEFAATWPGGPGASFGDAEALWGASSKLSQYDIVMLSCEGEQLPATKPQPAMQAIHDYVDAGGRLFAMHWQNIWIGGEMGAPAHGLADWEGVAQWDFAAPTTQELVTLTIDETSNPKGASLASWLVNVSASTTRDQVPVTQANNTLLTNIAGASERWGFVDTGMVSNHPSAQQLELTTPVDAPEADRCGRVVFSDMHVASGSVSNQSIPYPGGCSTEPLTAQEKLLAFMFFDAESCVGVGP